MKITIIRLVAIWIGLQMSVSIADEAYVSQAALKQLGASSAFNTASATLAAPIKLLAAPQPSLSANSANVAQVIQAGSYNSATVTQTGFGNAAALFQQGTGNVAVISQSNRGR
ncbi:hypothetical protein HCU64_24755 [Methylobacterium sp. C25]|uniref:hypothetical protein n=1 Tax=Methylobacterium sp. C25 TaxID=2721622 RepID=UPI001F3AC5AE|nr:hypothetical protein [Methylobacterium sp. C25]MCE4226955.1 hypothetical protein [Methylobacterium sp. C25]